MELNACQWAYSWKTLLLLCGEVLWFVFPNLSVEHLSNILRHYALLLEIGVVPRFGIASI